MDHSSRQYQSNHQQQHRHHHNHRSQYRNHSGGAVGTFVDSSSSSINHPLYHQYQTRRRSSNCTVSICYSYLIAIFSSFLVVLGIYLSLTKFNARFLYISLAGLLIEASGACIFCVSTIRKSRLAQYKQTSDDPILVDEIIANRQQQQQARAVTHLLTNRTLNNQSAIQTNNNDNVNQTNVEIGPPPLEDSLIASDEIQNQTIDSRHQDLHHQALDSSQVQEVQPTSDNEQSNCHDLPENVHSANSQGQPEQDELVSLRSGNNTNIKVSDNVVNNDESQNTSVQCGRDEPETVPQAIDPTPSDKHASSANDEPDLTPAKPQPSKRNPRPANIRRTLVMGLSGEEEVIEIDEQDLDDMSILPPSYESIATDSKKHEPEQLQQRQ